MAALSALAAYSDSDSGEEEESTSNKTQSVKVPMTSKNQPLLLHNKDKSGKVKVYLPQLTSSSNSEAETSTKDVSSKPTSKGLKGLMSVLPQPKNKHKTNQKSSQQTQNKSTPETNSSRKRPVGTLFVPYTLTGKTASKVAKTEPSDSVKTVSKSVPSKTFTNPDHGDEEEEEEEEAGGESFLFLKESETTPFTLPLEESSTHSKEPTIQSYSALHSDVQPYPTAQPYSTAHTLEQSYSTSYSPTVHSEVPHTVQPYSEDPENYLTHSSYSKNDPDDLELNDDIVRRLAGKRRGQKMNEETASLQHVKNVTETDVKDSVKVFQKYSTEQSATSGTVPEHLAFTSDQKRKHQITWLAHQAKSREIELKNFWAESASQRRQTKMKYGF